MPGFGSESSTLPRSHYVYICTLLTQSHPIWFFYFSPLLFFSLNSTERFLRFRSISSCMDEKSHRKSMAKWKNRMKSEIPKAFVWDYRNESIEIEKLTHGMSKRYRTYMPTQIIESPKIHHWNRIGDLEVRIFFLNSFFLKYLEMCRNVVFLCVDLRYPCQLKFSKAWKLYVWGNTQINHKTYWSLRCEELHDRTLTQ